MRQPAGIVWTETVVLMNQAAIAVAHAAAGSDRVILLATLANALERIYPDAIAFERELWNPPEGLIKINVG